MQPQPAQRTTRLSAIGRFRSERVARMDRDYAERQSMLLKVAEDVVKIVDETHRGLEAAAGERQAVADARRAWGDKLRKALGDGRVKLSETTAERIASSRKLRNAAAQKDNEDRKAFMSRLREDVVRICSEDFI